jgi:hypothetical protein
VALKNASNVEASVQVIEIIELFFAENSVTLFQAASNGDIGHSRDDLPTKLSTTFVDEFVGGP